MAFSGANMFALLDDEDGPKPVARAPAAKPAPAAKQADKSGKCVLHSLLVSTPSTALDLINHVLHMEPTPRGNAATINAKTQRDG